LDGLYGGDNLVDGEAVSWIQSAIHLRGANASVLWIDEPSVAHAWRLPPVLKAALFGCDILINNSFDITVEELMEFRLLIEKQKVIMVRNFATTAELLNTPWAQTPHELVSEIRYQAARPFMDGAKWQLSDENGTYLEGKIRAAYGLGHPWFPAYTTRREEAGHYRPWPEWVIPPVRLNGTSGTFIFDCMLSWWSRYIGISPYFKNPIRMTVENGRIKEIKGGDQADALRRFLTVMRERLGEGVYDFNCLHFGVHPQATVSSQQCPNIIHRRLIEHSHTSNIHLHIGAPPATDSYPYWMHVTGDVRMATFRVGDTVVHERGYLTAMDNPAVVAVAARYPGRPGLKLEPVSS
jgi:hypothetical protein